VANVAAISYGVFQQLHNYIFRDTTNSTAPLNSAQNMERQPRDCR
jgi:hypothetical protein